MTNQIPTPVESNKSTSSLEINDIVPFKVYVHNCSEAVQKHLMSLGCKWIYNSFSIKVTNCPFLFIDKDMIISYSFDVSVFHTDHSRELTANQVLSLSKQLVVKKKSYDIVHIPNNNKPITKMNTLLNFKVYTCGCNKEIQEHLTSLGCKYPTKLPNDCPFIYVYDGIVMTGYSMTSFSDSVLPEYGVGRVMNIKLDIETPVKFAPFTKVLARNRDTDVWRADLYSHYIDADHPYVCVGFIWKQCIRYRGNERLLGTSISSDCKEFVAKNI